jgi:hypothetical protein
VTCASHWGQATVWGSDTSGTLRKVEPRY